LHRLLTPKQWTLCLEHIVDKTTLEYGPLSKHVLELALTPIPPLLLLLWVLPENHLTHSPLRLLPSAAAMRSLELSCGADLPFPSLFSQGARCCGRARIENLWLCKSRGMWTWAEAGTAAEAEVPWGRRGRGVVRTD
jgi:hypothetical protein